MPSSSLAADTRIRSDYASPAIVLPRDYAWVASPQQGVERMPLDREGGETGRPTSIVRYAPGAGFPQHRHPLGEEVLVLEGTFSEGSRHHGARCYLRNPPGSSHAPSSAQGSSIFVKLGQVPPGEQAAVRVDTRDPSGHLAQAAARS